MSSRPGVSMVTRSVWKVALDGRSQATRTERLDTSVVRRFSTEPGSVGRRIDVYYCLATLNTKFHVKQLTVTLNLKYSLFPL